MTDAPVGSRLPRKRRWLRVTAWCLGILIALLIVVYFVATSAFFLKRVILPQVGKSIHADVTVGDASIHPFREITLRDLKVQPKGQEPILVVPEVRVRYSLMDIIRGNLHVDELTLLEPTVRIIVDENGRSNLDPILQAQAKTPTEKKPAGPAAPSKPLQIDVRKVSLTHATVHMEKRYSAQHRDVNELDNINVELDNLKNGGTGKLSLTADVQVSKNPPPPAESGVLGSSISGNYSFNLSKDLKPLSLKGQSEVAVSRAEGSMSRLSGFRSVLSCSMTPSEIEEIALRFQQNDVSLGELLVSGPFDAQKAEGRLKITLLGIDKRLLNLAGAANGLDFGTSTINSTNEVQLSNGGADITAVGRFNADRFQVIRAGQQSPTLDLHADYHVSVSGADHRALLTGFTLDGDQNGAPLLRAQLASPMTVAWGGPSNAAPAVPDSALTLALTNLNLSDWKMFLGETAPRGRVGLNVRLVSQQGGKHLAFDMDSQVAGLEAAVGSNRIADAGVSLQARGQVDDLKQFQLTQYQFQLTHLGQPVCTVSGTGKYDVSDQGADIQAALEVSLEKLLSMLPQPNVQLSSGTIQLKAHVTQVQDKQTVAGNLRVADLSGRIGSNQFNGFATTMDLDVSKTPAEILINRAQGSLAEAGEPGGSFALSGAYNLTNKSASIKALLTGFNQRGLGPVLAPLLADKKLVSIAINGNLSAQYDPAGNSSVQAAFALTNLLVSDPQHQLPTTPLEAKVQIDAGLQKQSADIRQFELTLTPTQRAQNRLQFKGHVDFSQTNAIAGALNLAAESLDLTEYYDLFAGQKPAEEKSAQPSAQPAAASAPAPAEASQEPTAQKLPFSNFTVQADIGRLYLREVEITNLQTLVKLDGGKVLLKPFQLSLNGAPVNATADLDLSVPGCKYALTFNADGVPFAPLVDTFQPDRKGQLGGALTAHARVQGTGTSGESLQKTLTGQFDIGTTNLNLSVVNVRSPILKTIINVVAVVPELLHNPAAAVGSLVGGLTGHGGLTEELRKSPIQVISARGTASDGNVKLDQAVVQSSAFMAEAHGNISLASVLTNSTIQIPITVSLSHSLASQMNLAEGSSAAYVPLPDFLTVKGTLGKPDPEINKLALLGTTVKAIGGTVPGTNIKAGGIIQGIGGLLGNQPSNSNSVRTNSPPASQPPPVNQFINNFLRPRKR